MAGGKWANNIVQTHSMSTPQVRPGYPDLHHILGLNGKLLPGAFTVNCCWVLANEKPGYMEAHSHPYDEVIGFIGTDTSDFYDLGAEVEMWMDDEQYITRNSCIIFIPKGLKHCPLEVRDIQRSFFHFDIQLTDVVQSIKE